MTTVPTYDDLLRELASLSYDARVQRMVELGREARSNLAAAEIQSRLAHGGFYERWLALQMCYGSGDGAHVLRALADASRAVRGGALRLVPLVCNDEQAAGAFGLLHLKQQRRLFALLARRHRTAPIDAMLLTAETPVLPQLLPYGSGEVVARLLERAFASAGSDDWRRLAARHLDLAAAELMKRASSATAFDQRLLWLANAVLPALAVRAPDQALGLVRALRPHVSLRQLELQTLAQRRPAAVVDLVLESGDQARLNFSELSRHLDEERLRALVERGLLPYPEQWLPRLAPALRRVAYEVAAVGWRNNDGALPLAVVRALPAELRAAEARRNLALPALVTRPAQQLLYAACLPWDEAQAALAPFVHNPDPTLRALALPTLIGAARYQPRHLTDALELVTARRNEQDPVRLVMLRALAELPPSRWRSDHLPTLGQIIRDTLDAADCSHATATAAEQLIIALLPFHPEWSAQWFATLVRERGSLSAYSLEERLTDADVARIAPVLLPVLQAWQPQERDNAIFQVSNMFGRRLAAFPALVALLEEMTRDSRGWVASRALMLIAEYQRKRLPDLIPELVTLDPSWVTQAVVYTYLHRRRQDLLTPFLGQTAYSGRFSTGKTRFVLPLSDGFYRWTLAQQMIFAEVLEQVTRDEQRDSPALFAVINQLAALPAVDPKRIIQLADVRNPRIATRDVALRALGRLDAGQGVPALLAALDDDRARVAIYALRRALLEMPSVQALELLRAVPLRKVTVAKEVVRLLGELPHDVAYAELLGMADEELHRDVRVALLRALWEHRERPETWPVFERAARDDDPAVAAGVIRIPADRGTPETLAKLARLLAVLLVHPAPRVRLDTLQRCAALPISDPERVLLEPLLMGMSSPLPDERVAASRAVFATYVGRDAALVGDTIRRIRTNRRALVTALEALSATLPWGRAQMLPTARATLAALKDDPLTASMQVELAASALLWDDMLALLREFAASGLLHADVVTAAVHALHRNGGRADMMEMAALEATLAAEPDARLRRVALAALVVQTFGAQGWSAERLERLNHYRADQAPLVAAAATFTLPPAEQ